MSSYDHRCLIRVGQDRGTHAYTKVGELGGCGLGLGALRGQPAPRAWRLQTTAPISQGVLQPAGSLPSSAEKPGFLCFCSPPLGAPVRTH